MYPNQRPFTASPTNLLLPRLESPRSRFHPPSIGRVGEAQLKCLGKVEHRLSFAALTADAGAIVHYQIG